MEGNTGGRSCFRFQFFRLLLNRHQGLNELFFALLVYLRKTKSKSFSSMQIHQSVFISCKKMFSVM